MKPDIKPCVDTRMNMFEQYVEVPDELQADYEAFAQKISALAEASESAVEFEQGFASQGLQEVFNTLVAGCKPKAVAMTAEQKEESRRLAKEMNKGAGKEMARDAVDMMATELKQEAISMNRKRMIEAGTFDEYTRVSNAVDDVKRLGRLFKKK